MAMKISIRTASLSIVVLSAIAMFGLIGLSDHTGNLRDANEAKVRLAEDRARAIIELELEFLHARKLEKDFLLHHDDKYVDQFGQVITHLTGLLATVEKLSQQIEGAAQTDKALTTLTSVVAAYKVGFARLVTNQKSLGYDENSGLQGKLRSAVHKIESRLNQLGRPEMRVKMLMMRRHEKDFILRGNSKYLDRLNKRVDEFRYFPDNFFADAAQRGEIDKLLSDYQSAFAAFVKASLSAQDIRQTLSIRFDLAEPILVGLHVAAADHSAAVVAYSAAATAKAQKNAQVFGMTGLGLFVVLAMALSLAISRPLRNINTTLERMEQGDHSHPVPGSWITETSAIADALDRFRNDLVEKQHLNRAISGVIAACAAGDFSRRLPVPDQNSGSAELVQGVNTIGEVAQKGVGDILHVLEAMSEGDLTVRMPAGHQGMFSDISNAAEKLTDNFSDIVRQLSRSSAMLNDTALEIANTAQSASQRGQSSAASLEETAAALQSLANTVEGTVEFVQNTENFVETAQAQAETSRQIADNASHAIERIKTSAGEIGRITDMIEDVAFQTNLLALNAGVEAARAGDAGRGFAVVAAEVRALAQRATEAALEINGLIGISDRHVTTGVGHVTDSVVALVSIQDSVAKIVEQVSGISASTAQQSNGIAEINAAMRALDQDVQNNVAILENAANAGQTLLSEAQILVSLVSRFRLSGDEDQDTTPASGSASMQQAGSAESDPWETATSDPSEVVTSGAQTWGETARRDGTTLSHTG